MEEGEGGRRRNEKQKDGNGKEKDGGRRRENGGRRRKMDEWERRRLRKEEKGG
jgi:hypothetical protein